LLQVRKKPDKQKGRSEDRPFRTEPAGSDV